MLVLSKLLKLVHTDKKISSEENPVSAMEPKVSETISTLPLLELDVNWVFPMYFLCGFSVVCKHWGVYVKFREESCCYVCFRGGFLGNPMACFKLSILLELN